MAYIIGNRNQKTLFPPTVEDYVGKEDTVRAYDAFVESMDFQELYGKYIYGDYCDVRIWALSYDGVNEATNELLLTEDIEISSFGVDKDNEIYICDLNGKIYKLAY